MNGTDAGSAVAAAAAAAPPTTGAASLAPGFRFHPTDEELVSYYLKRKVAGRPLRVDAIAEVDLYRLEPWELPGLSRIRSRDMEWFFFSPLDRKQSNRGRTNRATADGYWKTTGKDRSIRHGSCVVGMKKTLVFHSGRAPRGARTNWVMHEYRLAGDDRSEAGVPQDAYVVCRIFQKNGAGPQNGAQYGAPFVEEEWEDESAGQLSMMNEVGEFVDAGEPEYLQYNDLQNQNSEGQHDIPVVLQASPVGQHGGENADDTTALLDELLKEPSLINDIVDPVDEMGHPIPIHDFKREPHAEASSHISLVQTDEFLELNDLSDILNAGKLSSEDSMNHLVRNRHDESFQDRVGDGSNFKNTFKDEGSMNTVHQHPDQLEALQMRSFGDNMFMNSDRSHQQLEDVLAFYDAPGDDLAFIHNNFVQLNEFYHSPVAEQPSFDVPDDLMAYFDASDDNLQYDVPSFPEESEIFNSIMTQSNLANAAPGSIVTPGASFSASVLADDQLMNNYEGLNAESVTDLPENQGKANLPASQGKDKTVAGRLASMLGSIAAPSAYAAEIPSIPRKYFEGSFDNGSTNSLRVTAEPLHIHGLPVSGNSEHWSLQKNGDMGYLLSYNVKDDVVKKSPGSVNYKISRSSVLRCATRWLLPILPLGSNSWNKLQSGTLYLWQINYRFIFLTRVVTFFFLDLY